MSLAMTTEQAANSHPQEMMNMTEVTDFIRKSLKVEKYRLILHLHYRK